jgi:hypothetical protein
MYEHEFVEFGVVEQARIAEVMTSNSEMHLKTCLELSTVSMWHY